MTIVSVAPNIDRRVVISIVIRPGVRMRPISGIKWIIEERIVVTPVPRVVAPGIVIREPPVHVRVVIAEGQPVVRRGIVFVVRLFHGRGILEKRRIILPGFIRPNGSELGIAASQENHSHYNGNAEQTISEGNHGEILCLNLFGGDGAKEPDSGADPLHVYYTSRLVPESQPKNR
jgi:hypothetical protein